MCCTREAQVRRKQTEKQYGKKAVRKTSGVWTLGKKLFVDQTSGSKCSAREGALTSTGGDIINALKKTGTEDKHPTQPTARTNKGKSFSHTGAPLTLEKLKVKPPRTTRINTTVTEKTGQAIIWGKSREISPRPGESWT